MNESINQSINQSRALSCPKSGLHNPFKRRERYVLYGEILHRAGAELSSPPVMDFMAKCIVSRTVCIILGSTYTDSALC